jgi:GH3 auxin-responsive promoter
MYIELLPKYYGTVPIRDLGLLASEGRMSIPISDDGAAGVLNISSNFYEFIPSHITEPSFNEKTLLAHELEVGREYSLVVTTSSGLYRYQMYDIVRVEDFYNKTPLISFLNKGHHISSITGEKLSEYQAVTAVKGLLPGWQDSFFLISPTWDDPPHYVLLTEEKAMAPNYDWRSFLWRLDDRLQELNLEYAGKRQSNRLGPISWALVEDGTFSGEVARNRLGEQYKFVYLNTKLDHHKNLPILKEFRISSESCGLESA